MQTWTFGPNGIYTATWDGTGRVAVTLTAGGNFVAAFAAQSLSAALASPEYQAILSPAPAAGPLFSLVATTGPAGFALQNATPTILTWTAPNDGNLHRVSLIRGLHVTSAETGGGIGLTFTSPDGFVATWTISTGGQGTGFDFSQAASFVVIVKPGSTVTLPQTTALTAGAAVIWAEFWGS